MLTRVLRGPCCTTHIGVGIAFVSVGVIVTLSQFRVLFEYDERSCTWRVPANISTSPTNPAPTPTRTRYISESLHQRTGAHRRIEISICTSMQDLPQAQAQNQNPTQESELPCHIHPAAAYPPAGDFLILTRASSCNLPGAAAEGMQSAQTGCTASTAVADDRHSCKSSVLRCITLISVLVCNFVRVSAFCDVEAPSKPGSGERIIDRIGLQRIKCT